MAPQVVSFLRGNNGGIIVSAFGIRWENPFTTVRYDREVCSLPWQELPADVSQLTVIAHSLIQAAIAIRRSKFQNCTFCKQPTPPEWQHNHDVCRGCAEKHLGVVH